MRLANIAQILSTNQPQWARAALGAFAVFFTQSPSFLAHQRRMQETKGRSNAQTLFGIKQTPTDPQIRNLLDPFCPDSTH